MVASVGRSGHQDRVRGRRSQPGQVRIIGGRWRGRRIDVVDAPGLRPTGDRIRETLFNWLAPWIDGARCLDLFAGTGALGFEAASRGAASVVLVESVGRVARSLTETAVTLGADAVQVVNTDARAFLEGADASFSIVFVDPPFDADLHADMLPRVAAAVAPGGLMYVEAPRATMIELPAGFRWLRDKEAGDVRFGLLERAADGG
ncbi:MAG: 16S rRNA (guanine(966)-N(2))-methyltransferase RsmD [Pseudomonadota bacterium]